MTSGLDRVLTLHGPLVYVVIVAVVFAEDALFVGFVIPGETAAVLGGVIAGRGSANLAVMIASVIGAAIIGDSVGYEVGRRLGPRILQWRVLDKHRGRLDDAQAFLRRRGGVAVFLGRFVAFFRAVMPALAGTSRMSYGRFLSSNALGGAVWGATFVLIGYLAGNSYKRIEKTVGRGAALGVGLLLVLGWLVWRWHVHRRSQHF